MFFIPFKIFFLLLINFYKNFISPLIPIHCKFYPTCSSYSIKSLQKDFFPIAIIKITYRILRCNPFSKGGIDYP